MIFSGRQHHYLKLLPLYEHFDSNGDDIKFIIANNAINIDPSTEYLVDSGRKFVHIYDYLDGTSDIDMRTFKLSAQLFKVLNGNGTGISPFWIQFSLREAVICYRAFESMLAYEQPDAVIILHENNFWTKPLAYLCKLNGILCFAFQEGLLRHIDQENMRKQSLSCEYSDTIFVWSDFAKKAYIDAGIDEEKIVVSGPIHMDKWHVFRNSDEGAEYRKEVFIKHNFNPSYPLVVFALPLQQHYVGNLLADISALEQYCTQAGINLLVSVHPFDTELQKRISQEGVSIYGQDSMPVVSISDCVIVQHSTIGLEALSLGIPIVEIDIGHNGIIQSWADDGVALRISSYDDFSPLVNTLQGTHNLNVDHMNEWINKRMRVDGRSLNRCVDTIRMLFEKQ